MEAIRIAYVGEKQALSDLLGRRLDYYGTLKEYLAQVAAPRGVKLTHWPEHDVGMSDLSALASYNFVISNWNKVAFLLAQYLRQNTGAPAKLVLYSGVLLDSRNPLTQLRLPIPIEARGGELGEAEEIDVSLSSSAIANFGIFDYFVSKERKDWTAHTFETILAEHDTTAPNREALQWNRCLAYFIYRWPDYEFRDKSHHVNITSGNYERWYYNPLARRKCIERFEQHFAEDLMASEHEMYTKPIWGKPRIEHETMASKCFVLMPFSEPFNTIYSDHIKEPLADLGISSYRADDFFTTSSVMDDVWTGINNSLFLIAELTTKNPNVMYELGIAHTLGKPVILIAQNEADVPFDFRHLRHFRYEYTPRGCIALQRQLIAAASEIQARN